MHPPPVFAVHVAEDHPRAEKMPCALSQVTGTDEIVMQELSSGNVMDPVVVVLSAYVPSDLAVQVPVTLRDPVTGTVWQPMPTENTFMLPDKLRHDPVTFQVPTKSPPQGDTLVQLVAPPDWLPPLPPLLVAPPEFEAFPDPPPVVVLLLLHPTAPSIDTLTSPRSPLRMSPAQRIHVGIRVSRSMIARFGIVFIFWSVVASTECDC